jgi:hypothetical protein
VGVNKFQGVIHTSPLNYLKIYKTRLLTFKAVLHVSSVWKDCKPIKITLAIHWLTYKSTKGHFMHDAAVATSDKEVRQKSTIITTER